MLAPISNSRKDGGSSFRKLKQYILTERDPITSKEKFRGDYMVSDNLLSIETAHREMVAVADQNARVGDPIYHFQICWREGERPTRQQWAKAVRRSVEALGFGEHQYLAAVHENTKNFHVHVMVNRVHPEHYSAHFPRQDMPTLDKVMRELEHEDGWQKDHGFYRWDNQQGAPIRNTREEMAQHRESLANKTRGPAAKIEHYNDFESFQVYARHVAAKDMKQLLSRTDVTWQDVHSLLACNGLQLCKAEKGGYTVRSINQKIRAKASVVFCETFAGKANRETLERKLGAWEEPSGNPTAPERMYTPMPRQRGETQRDSEHREAQRKKREGERQSLRTEFFKYRSERRKVQKGYTASVRVKHKQLGDQLRATKAEIRNRKHLSWAECRAAISLAVAETITEQRLLAIRARRERLALKPLTHQQWVSAKAAEGDKRAIAQLRGWRYQDQRNVRRIEQEVRDSLRIRMQLTSADPSDVEAWAYLSNDDVRAMEHAEIVAERMAQMRVSVNYGSGHVAYTLGGKIALVDRGKAISVISRDEAATALALEMAVAKYGSRIIAQGSEQWKHEIAKIATHHNIFIEFTDPAMQRTMMEAKTKPLVRSSISDGMSESGSLNTTSADAQRTPKKDYAKRSATDPKAAKQIPLAQFIEHGESPRAIALRQQADKWLLMRESVLKSQSRIDFDSDTTARSFLEALYGRSAAHVFHARVSAVQPGITAELNIRNICIFSVAADRNGKLTYRISPADPARAHSLSDELAAILQQSAREAQHKSLTPNFKGRIPLDGPARLRRGRGGISR